MQKTMSRAETGAAMREAKSPVVAPDQAERSRALDPARSFLVQAPAGSGKTQLLTQRFLRLLGQAEKPDEIVAITFTNAAAAEMRHRILTELEKAELASESSAEEADAESLAALARRALGHSKRMGWQILDQPNQLRITTIDAFSRGLALLNPLSWGLLSGLGGRLDPVDNATDLYRRAATRTLKRLEEGDSPTRRSVEELLLWRDNNWKDVEELIVEMLRVRNRWHQEFVFARDADWDALRRRLEAPFCRAARARLERLIELLDGLPGGRERAHELARYSCANAGESSPFGLAERAEFPASLILEAEIEEAALLEDAADAHRELASFLLTREGEWRSVRGLNVRHGFPPGNEGKAAKAQFGRLVEDLQKIEGLHGALAAFQEPMPTRYTDEEWELVRHCFAVLREAAGQLQTVFAETGSVDFTQIAQIALDILAPENGFPSDFAIAQADSIRHLLIDEFQDTSRHQHELISRLIAAWPEREGRSCFCVGDPMQSIYSFREAEVELFDRVRTHGLETASSDPDSAAFTFDFVPLRANFRTVPSLVDDLNGHFEQIFAAGENEAEGKAVQFSRAEGARVSASSARGELHLAFTRSGRSTAASPGTTGSPGEPERTRTEQLDELVALVRNKLATAGAFRGAATAHPAKANKYRIAVLARTRKSLIVVAEALRKARIRFRSIDLVKLDERPEVLDALSLARALINPTDRTAWLGVLRAPWCGLSLAELHVLTSADDAEICDAPVTKLLETRLPVLFAEGLLDARAYDAASRVGRVLRAAVEGRAQAAGSALGTWLESVWVALGGGDTVDAEQRENLRVLWTCLDQLPEGELDLTGPGLTAALDRLYALPDPAASSDFGVQLMTIHKSKGLEFEVVIVPDLEVEGQKHDRSLMSWLERGLAESDDGEELTELLIAPIQTKGADASAARKWVERIKKARLTEELRRVLYVAATRARDELHLFARPRFREKQLPGGSVERTLCAPTGLLATAWPAFEGTTRAQFEGWLRDLEDGSSTSLGPTVLGSLAAQAATDTSSGNLLQMPQTIRPTRLKRLPADYVAPAFPRPGSSPDQMNSESALDDNLSDDQALFERTEGGLQSRLFGTAVHELMEKLSRLRRRLDPDEAALALAESLPAIIANMRGQGLPPGAAKQLSTEALSVAQQSLLDPTGGWILAPHFEAFSEAGWTGLVKGQTWSLRPDRVFFAPPHSSPAGEAVWWIIDYKTSRSSDSILADEAQRQAFLSAHREQHAGQLTVYAQMLRGLKSRELGGERDGGPGPIRVFAGIYYPRMRLFDSWEA